MRGKRSCSHREGGGGGEGQNQKRRGNERDEGGGNGELVVYRILCPNSVIGSVIGKGGKVINAIRQESKAKVKVVDPYPGASDRVVTIYCHVKEKVDVDDEEEFDKSDDPVCAAQDALFRMHNAIAGAVGMVGKSDQKMGEKEECRILVPSSQSSSVIGKSGSTIKRLRCGTGASIKVTPKDASDPTHLCAMDFDNFVLITGDSDAVKKALFAISMIMYKFGPKEEVPLETMAIETPPGIIPSDVPLYHPGGLYPSSDLILPSRSVPSIFGAPHVPELQGFRDSASPWPIYSSGHLLVAPSFGNDSMELKVRVLCPHDKIGRVIGKGGSTIKSIRQASGAHIDVDDRTANRSECMITINATEAPDDLKSMAVEAVLLLQEKINDEDDDTVAMKLLIPSKVIGCIIGKNGSIITEMRKRTNADIRVSRNEKTKRADASDESVEVTGEVSNVRDALVQIVLRLRDDVLKPNESVRTPAGPESFYSGGAGLSVPPLMPSLSPATPMGYDQRVETGSGSGLLSSGGLYGYGTFPVRESGYGSISPYPSSKLYGGSPATSILEMFVPANAVGKVMGKGGANITNIRKISGATVELSDPNSARGDRIALISGTTEQKRAAENLIQAFIMAT